MWKVFLLHSRWMGKMQVRSVTAEVARSCSQACPPGRAQVLAGSPQHQGRRPHGLWITRLADGAHRPTVDRYPPRPSDREPSQNRRARTGVGRFICQCRAVEIRGTARSARRTGGGGSVSISEPLDDPWAESGPSDRLPASRRRGDGGRGRDEQHDRGREGGEWEGAGSA